MKGLGLLLLLLGVAVSATLSTAGANDQGVNATAICHRTASKTTPYVKLRVAGSVLQGHVKHAADIIPAPPGGCPRSLLTAAAGGRAFEVAMTGEAENPAGDPVGTGAATIRMRAGQGQVCYRLVVTGLTGVNAAHIHRGAAGVAGPVVIPLNTPNAAGASTGCAPAARTLVAAILAAPASYYVNAHTAGFPAGAIRGQLTGTSAASLGTTLALDLKGTSEPNATGTAVLRLRKDATVCYRLHVENVTLPTTAAHIHRGDAAVNGPVVVGFTAPGADGNSSGCVPADQALIDEMVGNKPGFYVNVHTKEHPAGAIRAQLG